LLMQHELLVSLIHKQIFHDVTSPFMLIPFWGRSQIIPSPCQVPA